MLIIWHIWLWNENLGSFYNINGNHEKSSTSAVNFVFEISRRETPVRKSGLKITFVRNSDPKHARNLCYDYTEMKCKIWHSTLNGMVQPTNDAKNENSEGLGNLSRCIEEYAG